MNDFGGKFWDERYSTTEFIYGTDPNNFFKNELDKLNPGRILLLGEGEGRNAVYAALNGWKVDAVDFSAKAQEKALHLAKENNVHIEYEVVNLSNYKLKQNHYDAIAIIYLHLSAELRTYIHSQITDSLISGGELILEVFEKEQLGKSSGGPQSLEMLYSITEIQNDFSDLETLYLQDELVELTEGDKHSGTANVVRFVGVKDY